MVRTMGEIQESRLAVNIREVAFEGNEMTVRLTVDDAPSTVPTERLYTVNEVIAAQASEGDLIARSRDAEIADLKEKLAAQTKRANEQHFPDGPWDRLHKRTGELAEMLKRAVNAERKVRDLEVTLQESRDLVNFKDRVIDEMADEGNRLRSKILELSRKTLEYDVDRKTEQRRADEAEETIKAMGDQHQRRLETARAAAALFSEEAVKAAREDARAAAESKVWTQRSRIDRAAAALFTPEVDADLDEGITKLSIRLAGAIKQAREALYPFKPGTTTSDA